MYRVPQYSTQVHSHSRLTYFGFFILNIKYQHNMDERFINLQKDLCDASRASASVTWLTNSHWHDTGISRSTLHISSKHHKPQLPQRHIYPSSQLTTQSIWLQKPSSLPFSLLSLSSALFPVYRHLHPPTLNPWTVCRSFRQPVHLRQQSYSQTPVHRLQKKSILNWKEPRMIPPSNPASVNASLSAQSQREKSRNQEKNASLNVGKRVQLLRSSWWMESLLVSKAVEGRDSKGQRNSTIGCS